MDERTINNNSNTKRIARNTLYLYIRMFLSMVISFFTSRVILDTLGVSDYGVYQVVGGVLAMFGFLNASMSGATSRFITFELGKNTADGLKYVFNTAFTIHLIISVVIIILSETIGLWFLNNKLVIPHTSISAANVVFQISILIMVFEIIQVPHTAVLIANERMKIFAFFNIANNLFRLLIVYLLVVLPGNKLITFSILNCGVSIITLIAYRIYCHRNFSYTGLSVQAVRKDYMRPMFAFSGLDLFGNLSVTAQGQGINMLINIFWGTVANASAGIAGSICGAVNGFSNNVIAALRPQIIKSYSSGNYDYMQELLFRGTKLTFLIIILIGLPIIIECPFILDMWLVEVPDFAVGIARLTLIYIMYANVSVILTTGVHATGDIRYLSIVNGTLYLFVVPITYFAYKMGSCIYVPYIINIVFIICGIILNSAYIKSKVKTFSIKKLLIQVVLRCSAIAVFSAIAPIALYLLMDEGWLRFIIVTSTSVTISAILVYNYGLNREEQSFVKRRTLRFIRLHK